MIEHIRYLLTEILLQFIKRYKTHEQIMAGMASGDKRM